MSETRLDYLGTRVDALDDRLRRIEETVIRTDERLAAVLPHLATKAELADLKADMVGDLADLKAELLVQLADKPGRLYMWGVIAAMTAAYTAALAAIAILLTYLPHH
jgi:hypothetical protein